MITSTISARLILVQGRVQGIGFRPAVYRWAKACGITGYVGNHSRGVQMHVEADELSMKRFLVGLRQHLPTQAIINELRIEQVEPLGLTHFSVITSEAESGLSTLVPPDRAICQACLHELFDPQNRRYHHPFISCTDCGPRYSILHSMPFDRATTSLNAFPLCNDCRREYADPEDRRFQSQIISCPACGPRLRFVATDGTIHSNSQQAIQVANSILCQQGIIALKGLGGYQLLADPTSFAAIERLRTFKQRPEKSLAIMVRDLATAETLVHMNRLEQEWLDSPENPLLLLRQKIPGKLAANVAPGLNSWGIMLPTTPIHAMLLAEMDFALIVTSGNREGEPIIADEALAELELRDIVDGWLHHDRPIVHPLDDSVLRVVRDQPCVLRLARGLAPLPLNMPVGKKLKIVAVGGELKVAFALSNDEQTILGPHIGDLQGLETIRRWQHELATCQSLYQTTPDLVVHDLHPDYGSTRWADRQALARLSVQHHQAHLAAVLWEHTWIEKPVLGFAWDGTGWGHDSTIWGGECFVGPLSDLKHLAQLRKFSLPGGEQAIREPWRCAASVLSECDVNVTRVLSQIGMSSQKCSELLTIIQQPKYSPRTTSMGRLFDAAAALILHRTHTSYEGQAALELEHRCNETEVGSYPFLWDFQQTPYQLDWRPALKQLVHDLQSNVPYGAMAMRFHRGLALAVMALSALYPQLPIALTGGVFQNGVLVSLIAQACDTQARQLLWGGMIPPGDGGLAAGQLAIGLMNEAPTI